MKNSLSNDVVALGAEHGATIHVNLSWNALTQRARFRVTCHTAAPAVSSSRLVTELQELVRAGGFPDLRVAFESSHRFRIDAR